MAVGSPPTVRRRQLGRELRRLREESQLLAEQLADRLGCSPSRISRLETARIRITPGTVHEILDVLEIHGDERTRLVALAREAEEPGWWQSVADSLTYEYSTYIALESEATTIMAFEPIVINGLLQTDDYIRAIHQQGAGHRTPEDVEARITARRERRAVLTKPNPVHLHVVMDESVLHRVIGSTEILQAQLRHVIELAKLPNITIQILPFDRPNSVALLTGPIALMEFDDPSHGSVMYVESLAGDLYVEKPEAVRQKVTIFNELRLGALNPDSSAKMIKKALSPARRRGSRTDTPAAGAIRP
jgi:transcriptional regulator with XRE-family HTH domain